MYAYACQVQNLGCSWHLARVPIAAALDRPKWWFFAGSERWSSDRKDAQTVLEGGITWGILSVHWNLFQDTFLAIDSRVADAPIANRVEDRRVGPWTDAGLIEVDTLHSGPGWF